MTFLHRGAILLNHNDFISQKFELEFFVFHVGVYVRDEKRVRKLVERVHGTENKSDRNREKQRRGYERERSSMNRECAREREKEETFVRGPRVPEPILPSYLNSNSKYRRGLLTYCLFGLHRRAITAAQAYRPRVYV